MATYISVVKSNSEKIVRNEVRAPVFACMNALENAQSVDEIRTIIRNTKPINAIESKTRGIMKTTVSAVSGYGAVTSNVNAVTLAVEDVYLTEDCKVIGEDTRTYFLEQTSGEIRRVYKASTFFIIGE